MKLSFFHTIPPNPKLTTYYAFCYPHSYTDCQKRLEIIEMKLAKSDQQLYYHRLIYTSTLRLLGRFTTCLAQTTTASRLLFALNGTSCLKNEILLEIFDFKTFFKFCTITMTY